MLFWVFDSIQSVNKHFWIVSFPVSGSLDILLIFDTIQNFSWNFWIDSICRLNIFIYIKPKLKFTWHMIILYTLVVHVKGSLDLLMIFDTIYNFPWSFWIDSIRRSSIFIYINPKLKFTWQMIILYTLVVHVNLYNFSS